MGPASNIKSHPYTELDRRIAAEEARMRSTLDNYRERGLKWCTSSSFQTHSIPLLHLLRRFAPDTPVFFLDTGFHFPETLVFRDRMAAELGLDVRDLRSPVGKMGQRDADGRFLFASDPDQCCYLNKTAPMAAVLPGYDIWIAGLRRDQNAHRAGLATEAPGPHGTLRYHPMLDWDSRMIWRYRERHGLPEHPLEAQGFFSVGCEPCTQRFNLESQAEAEKSGRGGRWAGLRKTECGLHTEAGSAVADADRESPPTPSPAAAGKNAPQRP